MSDSTFRWQSPGTWRHPCIVHVTLVSKDRRPIFGCLKHNGINAYVEKSPLGSALIQQEENMLTLCPEIRILADKIMPDHQHIILQVTQTMPRSIKQVVRGYMQGCKAQARTLGFDYNIYERKPFYRVLTHAQQLQSMIDYVYKNAERAWIRRQYPELFILRRQTIINTIPFTSLGNHFLLDWPDIQLIEVSRHCSDELIDQFLDQALSRAENGAVTYCAAISQGERLIVRTLREHGYPLVVLLCDGFPSEDSPNVMYYKPGGVYFEACAKGNLLLLEPTEMVFYSPTVQTLTHAALKNKSEEKHIIYEPIPTDTKRFRFVALNEIAKLITSHK